MIPFKRRYSLIFFFSFFWTALPVHASPEPKGKLVHVGYLGESLTNVPESYGKMIHQKMLGLINQNFYEFHNPIDLYKSYGTEIDDIKEDSSLSINAMKSLASSADLNYIFITRLENIAKASSRVMLKGEVIRYNQYSNDFYRHEILSYVEDLDLHLQGIKDELISTIPHSVYGVSKNRIYLLIAVGFVLLFALSQSFGGGLGSWLGDGGGGKDPEPPIGN